MEYRVDERAKRIARKLRKIRELKGLTREKFCEPLGENSDYWGLIERGEQPISLPKLLQVCEVYQIPIESVVVLDYQIQDNGRVREDIDGLLGQCNEYQLEVIRKFISDIAVADGLFCREIDGLFCRSSPDIIVRRRCVLSHKRRGWLQPSPSFRYSRNLALQDELYHPVINNGPAVLVCVDKRLGTGPVNQSRDAG